MISAVNHKAIPFFDRIPTRALPAVRWACELVNDAAMTPAAIYAGLCSKLSRLGFCSPPLDEFRTWFEEVRLGRFTASDYDGVKPYEPVAKPVIERHVMDCLAHDPETGEAFRPVYEMATDTRVRGIDLMERAVTSADADPAALAFEIIERRAALVDAMLAAGYGPESCDTEDEIVAEAIESWLKAKAIHWSENEMFGVSPLDVALQLLVNLDPADEDRMLQVLATCMQPALMRAIIAA